VSTRYAYALGLFAVALALRLIEIRRSYDIYSDEITYTRIAMNLAHGAGLTLYGRPFDIHPPAAFGLFAAAILALRLHGDLEQVLFQLRPIAAICGALVPTILFFLVAQIRSNRVAFIGALVLAVDPFAILFDSRVMLEAPAQAAAACTFALVTAACMSQSHPARQRWFLVSAGLGAATVVTTKETFGLVILAVLTILWITGWVLSKRQALVVLSMAVTGYGLSVIGTALSTGILPWWSAKEKDFRRLIGILQETGFNAPTTHVTLLSRLFADAPYYAMTYAVLASGTLAAAVLVWHLRPWSAGGADPSLSRDTLTVKDRVTILIGVWTLCAAAYLVYATLFGSIEEQMYYILLAPACGSLVAWFSSGHLVPRKVMRLGGVVGLCLVLAFDMGVWGYVHTHPDNEYQVFVSWEEQHVPSGSVISVANGSAQFLLQNVVLGEWTTIEELRQHHVDYVVLATSLVQEGYGPVGVAFLRKMEQDATLVFHVNGPSEGSLRLYDVRSITQGTS
jgi:hypothetical protein